MLLLAEMSGNRNCGRYVNHQCHHDRDVNPSYNQLRASNRLQHARLLQPDHVLHEDWQKEDL